MRVTVCQLRTAPGALEEDWAGLVTHARSERTDVVVLPELGFAPWFAAEPTFDRAVWDAAVRAHDSWLGRLGELPAAVIGTRPVGRGTGRRNQAYAAEQGGPVRALHDKSYLPDEPGFWEASWYGRGDGGHAVVDVSGLRTGVLVCTELWFAEHARALGRSGAHVVATPRCTPVESLGTWLAGGRATAVMAGAWSLSSNSAEPEHGGLGWAVDPDGEVVATTSRDEPWVTVDVDLSEVEAAKLRYPRYVPELAQRRPAPVRQTGDASRRVATARATIPLVE
jgi:N-carbamoylputrescine amidase